MEIKINKIEEPVSKLFDSEDNLVGKISSLLELNEVRIQIKKNKLYNYYIRWGDHIIYLSNDGTFYPFIEGFYDQIDYQLEALL